MANSMFNATINASIINKTDVHVWQEPEKRIEAIIVPILFAVIFFVGVVGNSALIFIVLRNKSMRNTPNIFVVSLSVGDLLLLLFSVPFSSTLYTWTSWPFGEAICKFNEYMQTVSLGVSIFTLTALSGDRYIAIVHPMSKHTGKPTLITAITVVGIWILSIVLAIPDVCTSILFYHNTYSSDVENTNSSSNKYTKIIASCDVYPEHDFPEWYGQAYSMFRFIIYFMIPLLIIGVFYVLMAKLLIISSRDMPWETINNSAMNQQQKRQVEARLKVAKVVLSFVVIFIVCWLPRHVYLLWYYYSDSQFDMHANVLKITAFCLTYIYSCINPYALYFLSSQYRKYYNRYLFCCCPKFRYRSLNVEPSGMYNFNSTVRRVSTTVTGMVQSQSIC